MRSEAITEATIRSRLSAAGITVASGHCAALASYLELLKRWNRVYNLTGISDSDELIGRHLLESLALRPLLRGERIADVGSGAGLPGIPLAIVEPGRRFTLIESRAKRVRFLRHVIGSLHLANAAVLHARVENLQAADDFVFDTVLARAVAAPAQLAELTRHLTRPGSILLMLTAARLAEEAAALAADFVLLPVDDAQTMRVTKHLKSSIALMQRVDG